MRIVKRAGTASLEDRGRGQSFRNYIDQLEKGSSKTEANCNRVVLFKTPSLSTCITFLLTVYLTTLPAAPTADM
jgi:hypothetical protein